MEQLKTPIQPYSPAARWAKRVGLAVALAALAAVTCYGVWSIRRSVVLTRRGILNERFNYLANALANYKNDAGEFMPWTLSESGPQLNVQFWGQASEAFVGSYLQFDMSDPFASKPVQALRYWCGEQGWTIWSAGPDGRYDIVNPADYGSPAPEARSRLAPLQYDPSNGLFSSGDLFYLYRAAPEGEG